MISLVDCSRNQVCVHLYIGDLFTDQAISWSVKVIEGFGVARVVDSTHPGFSAGDIVSGLTGWEEYSVIDKPEQLRKIQQSDIPLSYHLGLLGEFVSHAFKYSVEF